MTISQLIVTYEKQFQLTFGTQLRPFMHPLFGFSLLDFESHLQVPEDVSIEDFIREKYGQDAVNMVRALLEV